MLPVKDFETNGDNLSSSKFKYAATHFQAKVSLLAGAPNPALSARPNAKLYYMHFMYF